MSAAEMQKRDIITLQVMKVQTQTVKNSVYKSCYLPWKQFVEVRLQNSFCPVILPVAQLTLPGKTKFIKYCTQQTQNQKIFTFRPSG